MTEVLGELHCTLDGRFSSVRTMETNLGNLVTDIMVAALNADCALLNSGTLRSDTQHPEGKFILRVNIVFLVEHDREAPTYNVINCCPILTQLPGFTVVQIFSCQIT